MKLTQVILLSTLTALIIAGCSSQTLEERNTFSSEDCPNFIDEAKSVNWARTVGVADKNYPSQIFSSKKDFGLRCYYWAQDTAGTYSVSSDQGEQWGNYSSMYEMEIRRFLNSNDAIEYTALSSNYMDDLYCHPDNLGGFVEKLAAMDLGDSFGYSERYRCGWQEDETGKTVRLNTVALVHRYSYGNNLITLRITREVGNSQNRLELGLNTEQLKAASLELRQKIFNLASFQELPTDYEEAIMRHLLEVLKQELQEEEWLDQV